MSDNFIFLDVSSQSLNRNNIDNHQIFDKSLKIEEIYKDKYYTKQAEVRRAKNSNGSTSVTHAARYTIKPDIIITLEKVEDDHRWLMSVQ